MTGSLRDSDDVEKELTFYDRNSTLGSVGDLMSLQDLLSAVHFGNFSAEYAVPSSSSNTSRRYDGMNIVVYIVYQQDGTLGGTGKMTYYYQPKVLADLEYKVE